MDNINEVHTKPIHMYLLTIVSNYVLTELKGRTGKYLARGHGVRTIMSLWRAVKRKNFRLSQYL